MIFCLLAMFATSPRKSPSGMLMLHLSPTAVESARRVLRGRVCSGRDDPTLKCRAMCWYSSRALEMHGSKASSVIKHIYVLSECNNHIEMPSDCPVFD